MAYAIVTFPELFLKTIPSLLLSAFLTVAGASNAQQSVRITGVTAVGKSALTAVTLTLPDGGTVDRVKVVTQGSEDRDFQDFGDNCKHVVYAPGQKCVVNVLFKPTAPGDRHGAVILLDGSMHSLAAQPLAAMSSGPIATFVPGIITTVAGNSSTFFYAGDGGPAIGASLFLPFGVVLNAASDLYIADTYNNRIRKVDAQTGIISTVAGNGTTTYSGDGSSALTEGLNGPSSVALDSAGNLYIADTNNNAVRMIDAGTGVITTIAGTGALGYSGDGGPALAAQLNRPNGIAVDANGDLFIADTGNNVVRVVSATTDLISTVAGTGTAGSSGNGGQAVRSTLNGPYGVAVSSDGKLYIADRNNNAVRMVDSSGIISTIAGGGNAGFAGDGGLASASRLSSPSSVVIDAVGNIYIADTQNNRIQKINPQTGIINTIAGGGADLDKNPATLAALYGPAGIALDGLGSLYIADAAHNRIRKVASNVAILNYPNLREGSVSGVMDQVIENDGVGDLDVSSIGVVANAEVDSSTTCNSGTSLPTLAQCFVAAKFAPATTNVTGTIQIDSNGLNANSTLELQGGVESTYPATVVLSSSPNPSIVGNTVQFSVQVLNQAGIVATGTVTLLDGTTTIGSLQLSNGNGVLSLSNLTVGQHNITASYGGDANDSSGVSPIVTQVVTTQPPNALTTISLTSSQNPSNIGQILDLNATVTAVTSGQSVPTGSVTFMDGVTTIGSSALNSGTASLATSNLTIGTHQLTAVYSGSSSYSSSTAPILPQVIVAPNTITTTTLQSSADPIGVGSDLTLYAAVRSVSPGQAIPTGTMTFMQGSTILGTVTLTSGSASFSTTALPVGTYLLTAVYSGSTSYTGSTSPLFTEIVVSTSTGNTPQFTITTNPSSVTLQSGSHATVQIAVVSTATFADTLALGCGGLPKAATCTFSQDQITIAGAVTKTVSVVIDTGNPLGSGASAGVTAPGSRGRGNTFALLFPLGGLLALFWRRRQGSLPSKRLAVLLISTGMLTMLMGCSSGSLSVASTPSGTYTLTVFGNGENTGASYAVPLQLTITK